MDGNKVKFRYGTPVTADHPELLPGSFVFDSASLALYLDTDTSRVQIHDPLKLSLTGGTLTGTVSVVSESGVTVSTFNTSGVIQGVFLETTGDVSLDESPDRFAVLDSTGRIRSRTLSQMRADLGIVDPIVLGNLAYKDSASGKYTPVGIVSTPTVTIHYGTDRVVSSIIAGDISKYEVDGEVLSLIPGTKTTAEYADVMKSITSVDVSQPEFTGTEGTVTVS